MGKTICYVGNWWEADKGFWAAGGKSTIGVCACDYDAETGALAPFGQFHEEICVGSQCVDSARGVLYVVDEKLKDPDFRVGGGGAVSAFRMDPTTGELSLLNRVPSFGALTSYVALDPKGEFLVVTNHASHNYVTKVEKNEAGDFEVKVVHDDATVVLYELAEDGSIGRACDMHNCHGTGPLGQQTLSHLHSVYFAPLGEFLLVCDKGGDLVHTLRIDRTEKKLIACCEPFHTEPGLMPRYAAFHPTRPFVYANNEAQPDVNCFSYNPDGTLDFIESVPCIDDSIPYDGKPFSVKQSDIRVSTDGRFLYALGRVVNTISTFSIDQETGKLTLVQCKQIEDEDPHSCCISPDGKYLLVGAMGTHQVVSFPILEDGTLGDKVSAVDQPSACSIVFATL